MFKNKSSIFNFFAVSGVLLFALWLFDLYLKISRYGLKSYDYVWICSLTLIFLSVGLIRRSSLLITSVFSIILVVQSVWILDYLWIIYFGYPVNGNAEYLFQTGYPIDEFLNSLRHLFIIPIGFYGWLMLRKPAKKAWVLTSAFVFSALIFSYFFTDPKINLNCVFRPCISFLKFGLPQEIYFMIFLFSLFIITLIMHFLLNSIIGYVNGLKLKKKAIDKIGLYIFMSLLFISTTIAIRGLLVYSEIPKYICRPLYDCKSCPVDLKCNFISKEHENFLMSFSAINKKEQNYTCDFYLVKNKNYESKELVKKGFNIGAKAKQRIEIQIKQYPIETTKLGIEPVCA